jgi:prepilin-type processing-associated H-X9-DG protein
MLGWRRVLGLAAVDGALFLLSGLTAQSAGHSGTVSNVLWVDFLLGVPLLVAVTTATAVRWAFALLR